MKAQLMMVMGYLRMTWMYRWLALVVAFLVCIGGWGYVLYLPNQYEVSARLYIDTQSMLRPLLQGLVVGDLSPIETLPLMRRTLLTRATLEDVARRTDLDLRATSEAAKDQLIAELSGRIGISSQNRSDDTYRLSFSYHDPRLTKMVVDELLSIFLESAIGHSRQDRAVATQFIDTQVAEYERLLTEAEERLKDFKLENMDFMPGSGADFYARLTTAQANLEQVEAAIREAESRRQELQRQVAAASPGAVSPGAASPEAESDGPVFTFGTGTSPEQSPEIQQIDQRIAALQSRLDELLILYTERHPEVVYLTNQLALARDERSGKLEEVRAELAALPSLPEFAAENPLQQSVGIALSQVGAELAALRTRHEDSLRAVAQLRSSVDTVPLVEAEFARLNRDYDINKRQYDELVARREAARLATDAEQAADPVKIKVIEPPRMPTAPIGPNRLLFLSGVMVAGILGGFGVAFAVSQISPRVFTRQELQELTGVPVLGAVSFVRNEWHTAERRTELAVFGVGLTVLVALYGGLVALHLLAIDLAGYVNRTVGGFL